MSNGKWKISSPAMLCDESSWDLTYLTVRSTTNAITTNHLYAKFGFIPVDSVIGPRGRIKPTN
jgi:hypothetical protein